MICKYVLFSDLYFVGGWIDIPSYFTVDSNVGIKNPRLRRRMISMYKIFG